VPIEHLTELVFSGAGEGRESRLRAYLPPLGVKECVRLGPLVAHKSNVRRRVVAHCSCGSAERARLASSPLPPFPLAHPTGEGIRVRANTHSQLSTLNSQLLPMARPFTSSARARNLAACRPAVARAWLRTRSFRNTSTAPSTFGASPLMASPFACSATQRSSAARLTSSLISRPRPHQPQSGLSRPLRHRPSPSHARRAGRMDGSHPFTAALDRKQRQKTGKVRLRPPGSWASAGLNGALYFRPPSLTS
jgi:hypothetical protein